MHSSANSKCVLFLPNSLRLFKECLLVGKEAVVDGGRIIISLAIFPDLDVNRCRESLRKSDGDLMIVGCLSGQECSILKNSSGNELSVWLENANGTVVVKEETSSQQAGLSLIFFEPDEIIFSEFLISQTTSQPPFLNLIEEVRINSNRLSNQFKNVVLLYRRTGPACSSTRCEATCPERVKPHNLVNLTTTGAQLYFRIDQIIYLFRNLKSRNLSVGCGNVMSTVILDTLLGILLSVYLLNQPNPLFWLDNSLVFANGVVNQLQSLLNTLMEMPAGLKLNRPLNTALGEFFQYHIYLWKTYMSIIQPLFATVAEGIIFSGVFGLTCVLGMLCDLLSLATIHIYCFYGYAARLYNFQYNGLCSLWRLFRGKKWNPLKLRVDSYYYSNEQLFLGSISFTVLIFLLPTILLYYLVFLILRLITLSVHWFLRYTISKMSLVPIYALILYIAGSKKIASSVYFDIQHESESDARITMRTKKLPLAELYRTNDPVIKSPLISESFSFGNTIAAVCTGKIIYPM
ncbi:Phosphatidylinositol N-acetylglucosaminyltransferase subunit Q [Halotydeus destructor]|nr:Phosphatidylinositol N-acetylglucosaminyltransferase subunit Q [Halotydeus destructor]